MVRGELETRTGVPSRSVPPWLRLSGSWAWRLLTAAAVVVVIAWGMAKLYLVVLPVFAATVLATFLVPPTRWLMDHKVPRSVAATLSVVVAVVAVLLVVAFATQQFASQANELEASSLRLRTFEEAGEEPERLPEQATVPHHG